MCRRMLREVSDVTVVVGICGRSSAMDYAGISISAVTWTPQSSAVTPSRRIPQSRSLRMLVHEIHDLIVHRLRLRIAGANRGGSAVLEVIPQKLARDAA